VDALDLTGDGLADLLVNTSGELQPEVATYLASTPPDRVQDAFAIDGATGAVLWTTDAPRLPDPPDIRGSASPGAAFGWQGTARTGYAVYSGDPCATGDATALCETILVEVASPPAAGADEATSTVTFTLDQFGPVAEPGTDIDLYVHASDGLATVGPLLDWSTNGMSETPQGEKVTLQVSTTPDQPSRFFMLRVHYYTSAQSGYRGSVSVACTAGCA
jgi:hypothetical protein